MKCLIIPVITSATEIVTKDLRKYLEGVPGKHSVDSLKKTAVIETSQILWAILNSETGSLSRWFKRSTREKKPVTRDSTKIIIIIISLGNTLMELEAPLCLFFKNRIINACTLDECGLG